MKTTTKELRKQAEEARRIRLTQPPVSAKLAKEQYERVLKGSRQ